MGGGGGFGVQRLSEKHPFCLVEDDLFSNRTLKTKPKQLTFVSGQAGNLMLFSFFQRAPLAPHIEIIKCGIDMLKWETATLFFDFDPSPCPRMSIHHPFPFRLFFVLDLKRAVT